MPCFHPQGGEVPIRFDREDLRRDIDVLILAVHEEPRGILNHVGVRQDKPVLRDKDAAAERQRVGVIVNADNEHGGCFGLTVEFDG